MKNIFLLGLLLALGLLGTGSARAAFFSSHDNLTRKEVIDSDAFIVGNFIKLDGPVNGELFLAGNTLTVSGKVDRSLYLAGNTIAVDGGAGYNAFLAGSNVTLTGEYNNDVYILAQRVEIAETALIRGNLRVRAQELILKGKVDGNVDFRADQLTAKAIIGGNLNGEARVLTFEGGAIGGDLTYRSSKDATGLDKVEITGKTERNQPTAAAKGKFSFLDFIYTLVSLFLVGGALILFEPKKIRTLRQVVNENWVSHFYRGLIPAIGAPVLSLLLFFTFIGWRLLILIMFAYLALVMVAGAIGLMLIGEHISRQLRIGKSTLWIELALGVLAVTIFRSLPNIGWVVTILLFLGATVPVMGATVAWWREKVS